MRTFISTRAEVHHGEEEMWRSLFGAPATHKAEPEAQRRSRGITLATFPTFLADLPARAALSPSTPDEGAE